MNRNFISHVRRIFSYIRLSISRLCAANLSEYIALCLDIIYQLLINIFSFSNKYLVIFIFYYCIDCIDCFTNVLYIDKVCESWLNFLKSRGFISTWNWSETKSRECVCHLQHVEAEGLVLRAEHTQLRPALHWPGNSNERVYCIHDAYASADARMCSMNGARGRVFTHRLSGSH